MNSPLSRLINAAQMALSISPIYSGGRPDVSRALRAALVPFPDTPPPPPAGTFIATPDYPVTVYYCKANLKTGNTVRIVQGRNVNDCCGVRFSSSLTGGPFAAEMIHGNSSGKAKASGARCVLTVTSGIITPVENPALTQGPV